MSVLCDRSLRRLLASGALVLTPPIDRQRQIQPASIDLRLGSEFRRWDTEQHTTLPAKADPAQFMRKLCVASGETLLLPPGRFLLGHTLERVELPATHVAQVNGKSSVGRRGIQVHATAGWIDPGFRGQITLELSNLGELAVELQPGELICQLILLEMDMPPDVPYRGRYQEQTGATPSRLGRGAAQGGPDEH